MSDDLLFFGAVLTGLAGLLWLLSWIFEHPARLERENKLGYLAAKRYGELTGSLIRESYDQQKEYNRRVSMEIENLEAIWKLEQESDMERDRR